MLKVEQKKKDFQNDTFTYAINMQYYFNAKKKNMLCTYICKYADLFLILKNAQTLLGSLLIIFDLALPEMYKSITMT